MSGFTPPSRPAKPGKAYFGPHKEEKEGECDNCEKYSEHLISDIMKTGSVKEWPEWWCPKCRGNEKKNDCEYCCGEPRIRKFRVEVGGAIKIPSFCPFCGTKLEAK